MLTDLFSPEQRNPDGTYNETAIFDNQIMTLAYLELITDDDRQYFEGQFIKRKSELHEQCMSTEQGAIPFMLCPNPRSCSFEHLMDVINIGGKSEWNTLFLDEKEMDDLWKHPHTAPLSHIACGIQIGITHDDPFHLKESVLGIDKAPANILAKIQMQPGCDITGLTLYEGLLLSLYYPDMYDVWDGIQTAATLYGKKKETLRMYWLNQKPNRFLKVARESAPLLDIRYISPRAQKRIVIEK